MSKKIALITLGCSKNTVDSEFIAQELVDNQFIVKFEEASDVDTVIINTCSFINDAKEESIEEILNYLELKKSGEIEKVYVVGCLAQRYQAELLQEMPEIDGVFSYAQMPDFYRLLNADFKNHQTRRFLSTPAHYAYLKISEGCDRSCAYCAIPLIRGKHVSKPENLLIEEAKNLAQSGVKELILTAQDLTYYGLDKDKKRTLTALVEKLVVIEGIEWIRLHYAYPQGFPLDLLDLMRQHPKICNYLDIPFQHINTEILQTMKRGSTSDEIYRLIEEIREKVPNIALRTTLITGFTGETLKQHRELIEFVKRVRFERLGVFTYSPEEGTSAFALGDTVSQTVKLRRMEELLAVQQDIALAHNTALVGQTLKTLIDREDEEFYYGRTEFDSPEVDNEVLISKTMALEIGAFYPVEITAADYFDVFGAIK